jgi:hypothetical protein
MLSCILTIMIGAQGAHSTFPAPPSSTIDGSQARPRYYVVDLFCDKPALELILSVFDADIEQRTACAERFLVYGQALLALDERVHQDVLNSGRREINDLIEEARKSRTEPVFGPQEERLVRQYLPILVAGRQEADALLKGLLDDLATRLASEMERDACLARMKRIVMWKALGEQPAAARTSDFNTGIDVFNLLTEACENEDGELAGCVEPARWRTGFLPSTKAPPDGRCERLCDALCQIMADYEIALHAMLEASLQARRHRVATTYKLQFWSTDPEFKEMARRGGQEFSRRYEVLRPAVDRIAATLEEELGPEVRDKWMSRFADAFCPSISRERDGDGHWEGRITFTRESVMVGDVEAVRLPSLPPGCVINDTTSHISYRVGESLFVVDGMSLNTSAEKVGTVSPFR